MRTVKLSGTKIQAELPIQAIRLDIVLIYTKEKIYDIIELSVPTDN